MALSARMLALIQKIEAADEAPLAGLRETARREAQIRKEATKKKLQDRRGARALGTEKKATLW
jgi:hypothetical protein